MSGTNPEFNQDELQIKKVENGYIIKKGRSLGWDIAIAKTLPEVLEIVQSYYKRQAYRQQIEKGKT